MFDHGVEEYLGLAEAMRRIDADTDVPKEKFFKRGNMFYEFVHVIAYRVNGDMSSWRTTSRTPGALSS